MTDTVNRSGVQDTRAYRLDDRYRATEGRVLLTGVQALARLPLDQLRIDAAAGHKTAAFASGYPGSPLGGLDIEMSRATRLVPELPFVHQPAVNEELGATSVMGSQLAATRPDARYEGVVGFWYGKAPGLDRAGDALRHGVFAGSSPMGGAVVLVGDDPDCKSSTMPSSSDASLVDLHMPILYPGTVAECLELGLHAVALSRASGLWTSMKIVTPIADGSGTVDLPALSTPPALPTIDVDGQPWRNNPSAMFLGRRMLEVERQFREIRLPLAESYAALNDLNRITVDPTGAWIGLVATGFTYYEVLDALRRLGLSSEHDIEAAGIRLLQLRMPVPFNADKVRHFARGLDEILVIEEKNPTLEWLIKDALYGGGNCPRILGKHHEDGRVLMKSWGRLDADAIIGGLRERLAVRLGDRLARLDGSGSATENAPAGERKLIPLSVNRTPFFCSGCPHNWGTKVPDESLVGAGTGCHGMTLLMDEERVGESIGITAMGGEGAQWIGMAPFVETDHLFQNYGDGTFFHSAQLALQYCIGAGMNMTFKILYNGTVAMTGGQDAVNQLSMPDLVQVLLGYGVAKVAVTTDDVGRYRGRGGIELPSGVEVHDRADIVAVQEDLRSTPGVTVLIHDQACAAELRRARKRGRLTMPTRRVVINHRICEGCGDCGDVSNCLSVQPIDTPFGRKTTIDQASCNFDESCLRGDCPAFMTVEVGEGESGDSVADGWGGVAADGSVPDPVVPDGLDQVRIRLAGIGGTGVVTVAQILSTAAMFDGWEVRGLDQTGLSQKAGPVVSDIVLARPGTIASNLVGERQADVILGFDAMVALADGPVAAADRGRSTVIVSTRRTPTGRMVSHPDIAYPTTELEQRLATIAGSDGDGDGNGVAGHSHSLDSVALASSLTGSAAAANILMVGVALQLGTIPVSVESVEQAIDLNGVAVDANLAALDWGRRWAHDRSTVEQLAAAGFGEVSQAPMRVAVPELPRSLRSTIDSWSVPADVDELLSMLAADLVAYQDRAYAASFLSTVAEALAAERSVRADSIDGRAAEVPLPFTTAVARNLHKLMAYKDEYEVARLLLGPEGRAAAEAVGGPDAEVSWHLHPPMLKALGLDDKIPLGPWATPMLKTLAAGKRLRSTRMDPFGRMEMRRIERSLIDEYRSALDQVIDRLSSSNLDAATALAQLPDIVRGYEDLKLRRVAEFRDHLATTLTHNFS
ncbi:MAG: indolepyruvate ferredoxin oxidoreductase family protein [Acidimicrobiia bacterium]|nr:indolepyruvate ferredoxin oxidoreductase family protein [Acidimicrobiia bacterium]